MSNTTKKKNMTKAKQIKELKEELKSNDVLYKKNIEQHKIQVQIGLYQLKYPQGAGMYDAVLKGMMRDVIENELILKSNMETINPVFKYQTDPVWIKLQLDKIKEIVKNTKESIKNINEMVETVEKDITEQNKRILARRVQVIGLLKELNADMSDIENSD